MKYLIAAFCLLFVLSGCTWNTTKNTDDDTFLTIRYNRHAKREKVPISEFVESLQIIKLDNQENALVRPWRITVSDNYIAVIKTGFGENRKLFDIKGNYLCDIGAFGQGPGEYQSISSGMIDEKNRRIYLAPFFEKKLLAYNFNGKFLPSASIPWAFETRKPAFYINKEGQLVVLSLSFSGSEMPVCWVQDLKGNVTQSLFSESYQVIPDFSNELQSSHNTDMFDVQFNQFYKTKQDTLHHYDIEKNQLIPKFSVFNPDLDIKHNFFYFELAKYYCTMVAVIEMNFHIDLDVKEYFYILTDKSTGKEKYCTLYNDFLGGIEIDFYNDKIWFANGYISMIMETATLKELFEKRLNESDITDADRKVIEDFDKQISENDNCIVMYGKLKI